MPALFYFTIIFHLMLTALLANMIATLVTRHSFYDYLKDQYIGEVLREGGKVPLGLEKSESPPN